MQKHIIIAITTVFLILSCSCVTRKKTTYLQEFKDTTYPLKMVTPETYRIQPHDNLYIRVITPDPQWAVLFNTVPITSFIAGSEASVDLISYAVQDDGTIDFPYVGAIHVAGKTLRQAKSGIDSLLVGFIRDADVMVKLVNNYISLVGDVRQPGKYPIYKEQMNIFQALAMAGDMDDYSNRKKVQIIRQTTEGSVVKEFDLRDKKIIESEFYYVMPNDVIYAEPMKGKFFQMNSFPYAVILTTITTFVLIWNVIQ